MRISSIFLIILTGLVGCGKIDKDQAHQDQVSLLAELADNASGSAYPYLNLEQAQHWKRELQQQPEGNQRPLQQKLARAWTEGGFQDSTILYLEEVLREEH
ncbi:MAG: hypothetical protein AAFV07_04930, partial [Bacteroidota bacterium]